MASNRDPDEDMFHKYIDIPQDDDDGVEIPSDLRALNSGNHPPLNISNVDEETHQETHQDDPQPQPSQCCVEFLTIDPHQLDTVNLYAGQSSSLSTSNSNNSQSLSTHEQPTTSTQQTRRLRRIEPAPARDPEGTSLQSTPSYTDTSSSASGPVTENSSQPTPQGNFQSDTEQTFHCDDKTCKSKVDFKTLRKLKKHQKYHDKRCQCRLCDYKVAYPRDLQRHIRLHHPSIADEHGIPSFQPGTCPEPTCRKTFTRLYNMQRHQRKKKHGIVE